MALYLHRKNNLADVADIYQARKNLGYGTVSYFDSNNVNITGGSIQIDSLTLKSDNAGVNKFLVCDNDTGKLDFIDVSFGDWVNVDASQILISDFNTDNVEFTSESLCNIALTGDYNDLINIPTNWSHLQDDLTTMFMIGFNNLSELTNTEQARNNLGLGNASLLNNDDAINLNNLTITNNLIFSGIVVDDEPKYLHIKPGGQTEWNSLIKADKNNYGVVKLSDDYNEISSNIAPSLNAINSLYNHFDLLFKNIEDVTRDTGIQETISNNALMKGTNNLSELTNVYLARSNLGFNMNSEYFLEKLNSNLIEVKELRVTSNLVFDSFVPDDINRGVDAYLKLDEEGRVLPKIIPIANEETRGFVKMISDVDNDGYFPADTTSTLSSVAFSNYIQRKFDPAYAILSNSIPLEVRRMYNEYMRVDDNLRVLDPNRARNHLRLSDVAHTGDYKQLFNRPSNLSEFSNETTKFMTSVSNLAEVYDIQTSRRNLLIGSLASFDSNNVLITGGNAAFSNLYINKMISYNYDMNVDFQNKYLRSVTHDGRAEWMSLPEATSTRKGIVKISTRHTNNSDSIASSASALFEVYYKLQGKVDLLNSQLDKIKQKLNIN